MFRSSGGGGGTDGGPINGLVCETRGSRSVLTDATSKMLNKYNYRKFIAILVVCVVNTVSSKRDGLRMVMDKPADVCEGFDESKFLLDFSTLEFVQTDDDKFHISGSVMVKETIEAPIKVIVKSSKAVNGMWMPGLVNTAFANICKDVEQPSRTSKWTETLKPLTSDGNCPLEKGNHEYDDLEFPSINQLMENIPRSLYGKWRAKVQIEKNKNVLSCNYFYFTFVRS